MESTSDRQHFKDKIFLNLIRPMTLTFLLLTLPWTPSASPHIPVQQTWEVTNEEGDAIWSVTALHPPWTWWPDLTPDICKLAAVSLTWDLPDHTDLSNPPAEGLCVPNGIGSSFGCSGQFYRANLRSAEFYVCPGQGQPRQLRRQCGGAPDFFCASWGCETTGEAYWNPSSSWDLVTVKRNSTYDKPMDGERNEHKYLESGCALGSSSPEGPCKGKYCNPIVIRFTEKGKQDRRWLKGNTWGLRLYTQGKDHGLIFKIKLTLTTAPTMAIGPNPVLAKPHQAQPRPQVLPQPTPPTPFSVNPNTLSTLDLHPSTGNQLLDLVTGAYQALNYTSPEKTEECWMCLTSRPPYYEGIALMASVTNSSTPDNRCLSNTPHRLTLSEISGQGTCLGTIPSSHKSLCNITLTSTPKASETRYLTGPNGTYWACNTGLTPCVTTSVLKMSSDFCVLIQLFPKITYHDPSDLYRHFEGISRYPREPISITLALLLGRLTVGGITAGIGTGSTALTQVAHFQQLQQAMNADFQTLEESISALEQSLTSLSEVVLQNRRELDILFLKEGGLCAALKEECCFYADHTGVVRDSMSKLRERLKQRQLQFESGRTWYENWFNKAPWFTTLISTIMGPLLIIILLLLFGPCILNRLMQFIRDRDRLSVVQALVLTQQYQQLQQDNCGWPPGPENG